MAEKHIIGNATLYHGECVEIMRGMDEASVDAIVTDPPYHLTNKRGGPHNKSPNAYSRAQAGAGSGGFMSMKWDGGNIAHSVKLWTEVLRVLKPGGYLLAFGGTRTYHRLVCAIEDAGFEIRDQIGWAFGSGFPKSHNGEWGGTALKPAWEPICMARKPLAKGLTVEANWREHGTGAINVDGCRVDGVKPATTRGAGERDGWGMQAQGRIVDDGLGRWPANLIHDGSDEVLACFPQSAGQLADANTGADRRKTQNTWGAMARGNGREGQASADSENGGEVGFKMRPGARRGDTESAARFFYCSKASRKDRSAHNSHPTVKPTDLMRYLCRLVTPKGGTVLDPFMGSGSTLKAAELEGFSAIGIELDPEYIAIAKRRIASDMPLFA